VLANHSKSFLLIDCISVGVDRMQSSFEPMPKQVEAWQRSELTDVTAKVVVYEAFVEGKLEAPKHLARTVHDLYFEPKCEGISVSDDLESFERLHLGIQGTGSHSTVQGHGQTGRISGSLVVPIVLAGGAVLAGPPFPTSTSASRWTTDAVKLGRRGETQYPNPIRRQE
jgi:hypothetical protein